MKTERWNRMVDICLQAFDLPEAERDRFVAEVCGDDADLRDQVIAYLADGEQASQQGFLAKAITWPQSRLSRKFAMRLPARKGTRPPAPAYPPPGRSRANMPRIPKSALIASFASSVAAAWASFTWPSGPMASAAKTWP